MRKIVLAAAAAAGMAMAVSSGQPAIETTVQPESTPRRPQIKPKPKPRGFQHQDKREIARRLRQAARNDQRQRARAAMVTAVPAERTPVRVSRRWRWMA